MPKNNINDIKREIDAISVFAKRTRVMVTISIVMITMTIIFIATGILWKNLNSLMNLKSKK